MRAIIVLVFIGFLVSILAIEAYLRYDDYSALRIDYVFQEWDGRDRRVIATREDLADPRHAIVVLGDSMVAGVSCGREQNLVGHFAEAMRPIAADYKAINLGSANTSVFSYLDQLQGYEAGIGAPAGVVVMLYINDTDVIEPRMCPVIDVIKHAPNLSHAEKADLQDYCVGVTSGETASGEPRAWFAISGPVDRWLHGLSFAYRFFRESFAMLASTLGSGEPIGRLRYPGLWSDPDSLEFRLIAAGLQEIKALADRDGIPMLVAFYPPVEFLSETNPVYGATEIAGRELAERLGVPVLNGFEAYLDDPRASRNMARSLTDAHPSCLGHKILAEWLVHRFAEAGGFDHSPATAPSTLTAGDANHLTQPTNR